MATVIHNGDSPRKVVRLRLSFLGQRGIVAREVEIVGLVDLDAIGDACKNHVRNLWGSEDV